MRAYILKNWVYIAAGILLLLVILGGGSGYSYHLKSLEQREARYDSVILAIQEQRQQYLDQSVQDSLRAARLQKEVSQLQISNEELYKSLQYRRTRAIIIDTDFMANAKRLASGADRFYQEQDSIR